MSTALDIASLILLLTGSAFALIGGIGIIRLPDFFTRMHGAAITDTMGAGLILIGLILQSPSPLIAIKLIFILGFLFLTSPTAAHALARSALSHGIDPRVNEKEEPKSRN